MLADMCSPAEPGYLSTFSSYTSPSVQFAPGLLVLQHASGSPSRDSVSGAAFPNAEVHGVGGRPGDGSPTAALLLATLCSSSTVLVQRGEPSHFLGLENQEMKQQEALVKTPGFKGRSSDQADLAGRSPGLSVSRMLVARLRRAQRVQVSSCSPLIIRQALPTAAPVGWLS